MNLLPLAALLLFQQTSTTEKISTTISWESNLSQEVFGYLSPSRGVTLDYLKSLKKDQFSYKQLPSKRYVVAFFGKGFDDQIKRKLNLYSAFLQLIESPKPLQFQQIRPEYQEALADYLTLMTMSRPDPGMLLTAGTTTSAFYEFEGKLVDFDESSSVKQLKRSQFTGSNTTILKEAELKEVFERNRSLYELRDAPEVVTRQWVDLRDDGLLNSDLGETTKFYLETRTEKLKPLKDVVAAILRSSKETKPDTAQDIESLLGRKLPEQTAGGKEALRKYLEELEKRGKKPRETGPSREEIKKSGKFRGDMRYIVVEMMYMREGKVETRSQGIAITSEFLPKPKK